MVKIAAEPGTVSHATMRAEDLIPVFVDCLDDLKEKLALSAADPANSGHVVLLLKPIKDG